MKNLTLERPKDLQVGDEIQVYEVKEKIKGNTNIVGLKSLVITKIEKLESQIIEKSKEIKKYIKKDKIQVSKLKEEDVLELKNLLIRKYENYIWKIAAQINALTPEDLYQEGIIVLLKLFDYDVHIQLLFKSESRFFALFVVSLKNRFKDICLYENRRRDNHCSIEAELEDEIDSNYSVDKTFKKDDWEKIFKDSYTDYASLGTSIFSWAKFENGVDMKVLIEKAFKGLDKLQRKLLMLLYKPTRNDWLAFEEYTKDRKYKLNKFSNEFIVSRLGLKETTEVREMVFGLHQRLQIAFN